MEAFQDIHLDPHVGAFCKTIFDAFYHNILLKTQMPGQVNHTGSSLSDFLNNLIGAVQHLSLIKHIRSPAVSFFEKGGRCISAAASLKRNFFYLSCSLFLTRITAAAMISRRRIMDP